jgi:hypothetical protein
VGGRKRVEVDRANGVEEAALMEDAEHVARDDTAERVAGYRDLRKRLASGGELGLVVKNLGEGQRPADAER